MRAFFRQLSPAVMALVVASASAAPLSREQVEKAAEALKQSALEEMKAGGIPGLAFAVVFNDEVIAAEGLGVREAGSAKRVDADTVFQLASVSKPIGSTVVAALVGRKITTWDARISDLDPTFEMFTPWVTRELTIRDLYGHRSGLPPHAGDLLEDMGYSREEVLHRLRFQPPDSSFRAAYAYTNFGLTEAALAAAKATGEDWAALSDEFLYQPLGMKSTSSRYADFERHENRALGHQLIDGKWVHREQRQPDAQSPAGGVSSSVNDLTRWMRMQIDGGKFDGRQIMDPTALEETHHPLMLTGFSPLDGTPGFYGLGWNVRYDTSGRLRISHSGAFALGAATFVGLIPSEKLGVIILTNASPIGVPEALGEEFFERALTGTVSHDWMALFKKVFAQMNDEGRTKLPATPPVKPTPAADSEFYIGTYANDFFGPVEVVEKDGGLTLVLGPKPLTLPLAHWDRDTFTYLPVGENAEGRAAVIFTSGPNGHAGRVWIENLDAHGLGTFSRNRISAGRLNNPPPMSSTLERFHAAQDGAPSGFDTALRELEAGRKTSHWIWYIFPQLTGLGHSPTALHYAIRDFEEACDYLRDASLRKRLIAAAEAVQKHLLAGVPATELMGGATDTLKLVSSLTLFEAAAPHVTAETAESSHLENLCKAILGKTDRQGFPRCEHTLAACPPDAGASVGALP